ncbi:MAG: hypothetical protein FJZ97_14120, partial [Chloroflexi bacterium]|nr:hypothetical protein [Chloroflexota bacterium]
MDPTRGLPFSSGRDRDDSARNGRPTRRGERHMSLTAAEGRRPGIVMDLDGTVWVGGRMIAGALECLAWLKQAGFPLVYLTNNPVRPESYASRLTGRGLPTEPDEVMTASTILKDHLREVMPSARLFVLSDPDVRAQFEPEFAFSDD